MYGCESWTIKKAEHQRIGAFELWCWKRLLRVPWTARKSNQNILKEISPGTDAEAETPILWPPDAKSWLIGWCWERLRVEGEGDDRGWDGWMASPTQWTWIWVDSSSWWWIGRPGMLRFMGSQESDKTERLNWTEALIVCKDVKKTKLEISTGLLQVLWPLDFKFLILFCLLFEADSFYLKVSLRKSLT